MGTSISRNTPAACPPVRFASVGTGSRQRARKPRFKPDPQIFGNLKFDYDILHRRLQELAFLNRRRARSCFSKAINQGETFPLRARTHCIRRALESRQRRHCTPILCYITRRRRKRSKSKSPFNTTAEYTENVHSYVNNINTIDGGTHLSGFRTALTRTLNNYGKKDDLFKDLVPTGDDFREGLTAIISVRVPEPQFEVADENQAQQPAKSKASSTRSSAITWQIS